MPRITPEYQPEYAVTASIIAMLGGTKAEVARGLNIGKTCLNNWRRDHPDFKQALEENEFIANAKVAQSLFRRATGYKYFEKEMPPDVLACIFWLKNRDPKNWRDVKNIDANLMNTTGKVTIVQIPDNHREDTEINMIIPKEDDVNR